jgi:SNF2 family DNA or RNA helicase
MPLPFDLADIEHNLETRFIERGRDYFRRNKVRRFEFQGRNRLGGEVSGSGNRVYEVDIQFHRRAGVSIIDGDCSCPVGYNCKHVAAVLFAALEARGDAVPVRSTRASIPAAMPARDTGPDPAPLDGWLAQLDAASGIRPQAAARDRYPPTVRKRLLYVLQPETWGQRPVLGVRLLTAYLLKNGRYGSTKPYSLTNVINGRVAAHILAPDLAILRRLHARSRVDAVPWQHLHGPDGAELLAAMLATGRCHWGEANGPCLAAGAPRTARPTWTAPDERGRQRPVLEVDPPASELLPLTPPWYLDLDPDRNRGQCGPLETGLSPALLDAWRNAPPVGPEEVETVGRKLAELHLDLPAPRTIPIRDSKPVAPVPKITLTSLPTPELPDNHFFSAWEREHLMDLFRPEPVLILRFDYDGIEVAPHDPDTDPSRYRNGELLRLRRHPAAERLAEEQLASAGLLPVEPWDEEAAATLPAGAFEMADDDEAAWLDFLLEQLPELRAAGWQVDIDADFPLRLAEVSDWQLDLDEQPDNHWFDLDLGIEVDGERLPLLPILLDAFERIPPAERKAMRDAAETDRTLFRLADGRLLPLPTRRIGRILDVLVELFDREGLDPAGRLRLPEWRAAELAELSRAEPALQWQGGERLRTLAERLQKFERIRPAPAPRGFRTTLRPYQKEGLGWLQFLREQELHGILADDMGLGKTVQTLAHILREKTAGRLDRPALVVAPTSLMYNWRREAEQFTPQLSVLTLHGPDRKKDYPRIAEHDLVLTTYPLLPRDEEVLLEQSFHLLILDEAQQIKNPKARAAQVARRLDARHRLCLTGTPLENHLGELWSLFHFLMPGLLGDERQFRRLFRTPIEKHGDTERATRLARRVAPFMLRRNKEDVASELPPKTEIVRSVPLEKDQRDLYESIRLTMDSKVRQAIARQGLNRSHIIILDALLKLRQICCDPRLLKVEAARKVRHSAKLELLLELLPELLDEGRRILLFSQFTSMLALIEKELKQRGIDYLKLTGQTRDRATPIQRFQNGEVPLFLISLKAGGTGLNLTAADTVIHYDPWWNPAVENQATDRVHRIGQDKPVFVYKLLTEGTVEERIQAMQARKRQLADNLFAGAGQGKLPGPEEIAELFGPLE